MKVSEKLLRIRAAKGLSQEELARELGVSFTTINRWENEKTAPSKLFVLLIEDYCKKNKIELEEA